MVLLTPLPNRASTLAVRRPSAACKEKGIPKECILETAAKCRIRVEVDEEASLWEEEFEDTVAAVKGTLTRLFKNQVSAEQIEVYLVESVA